MQFLCRMKAVFSRHFPGHLGLGAISVLGFPNRSAITLQESVDLAGAWVNSPMERDGYLANDIGSLGRDRDEIISVWREKPGGYVFYRPNHLQINAL